MCVRVVVGERDGVKVVVGEGVRVVVGDSVGGRREGSGREDVRCVHDSL